MHFIKCPATVLLLTTNTALYSHRETACLLACYNLLGMFYGYEKIQTILVSEKSCRKRVKYVYGRCTGEKIYTQLRKVQGCSILPWDDWSCKGYTKKDCVRVNMEKLLLKFKLSLLLTSLNVILKNKIAKYNNYKHI